MINIAKRQMGPEEKQAVLEVLDSGMIAQGIGGATYYPVLIHKQTYYVNESSYAVSMPGAEQAALEVVSLPVHPALSEDDLGAVVEAANSVPGAARWQS